MKTTLSAILIFAALGSCPAATTLHPLFSNHMVLQRDTPIPIRGKDAPGETVKVEFAGQAVEAVAKEDGTWIAELAPLPASAESRDLVATGSSRVVAKDVLVGDVWLASGQSNMNSPLRSGSAAEAVPESTDPLLRFFNVKAKVAAEPQIDLVGKWEPSSPSTSPNFSAVAWFFAREIRKTQDVPIGIISAAWGGTPIKTWINLESLQRDPPLTAPLAEWDAALAKHQQTKGMPQLMEDYYRDMKDWETNVQAPYKAEIKTYLAAVAAAKAAGQPIPPKPQLAKPEPEIPDPLAHPAPSKRPTVPSHAFNGMIAPIVPYAIKGFLWYQGEADGSRGVEYRKLFPRLIEGWRSLWNRDDLPFLFVQLPGSGNSEGNGPVDSRGIAVLRDAQASALSLPRTGMTVTLDIGDAVDVHPDNKIHVGRRLALLAREKVYGESVSGSGPDYRSHEIQDGIVRVKFDQVGGGLLIGEPPWHPINKAPWPSDKLLGFAIRGDDGKWVDAEARIEGDEVLLSSPSVPVPVAVAYGWAATPAVNLYNKEGLPAAPFRSDNSNAEVSRSFP